MLDGGEADWAGFAVCAANDPSASTHTHVSSKAFTAIFRTLAPEIILPIIKLAPKSRVYELSFVLEVITQASGVSRFIVLALIYELPAALIIAEDLVVQIEPVDHRADSFP